MKRKEKIGLLITEIEKLIQLALEWEEQHKEKIERVHPKYYESAINLIHYRALKSRDLSTLQKKLGNLGLSRLTNAEDHIMASLQTTRSILKSMLGKKVKFPKHQLSFKRSRRLIRRNAKALLGYRSSGRRTRIMVTLPSTAANDYQFVYDLIANGMNCARINCAHDSAEKWLKMIKHIRQASRQIRKKCKIAMDLGGTKIRTCAIAKKPGVVKIRPPKDYYGNIIKSAKAYFGEKQTKTHNLPMIPIKNYRCDAIKEGDVLGLKSEYHKKRKIKVMTAYQTGFIAEVPKTTYFESGMQICPPKGEPFVVNQLPEKNIPIFLNEGDILIIKKERKQGQNAQISAKKGVTEPAFISCNFPQIFDMVKCKESILFDDGKIEGIIQKVSSDRIHVLITKVPNKGGKLRADKGINFPQSKLQLTGLTKNDKRVLPLIIEHADVVNMSFVNRPEDVAGLIDILGPVNEEQKIGVILKIETQSGFNKLPDILLEAMQVYPIGLMIARGDLAIELGWDRVGRTQEEILSICKAAHITSIWATQVLENLAKTGIPSRAEITDTIMAHRADCVMLNKGPNIIDAIRLLDSIIKDMKTTSMALKPVEE